ncbi:ABC transporter ATP-binding protein [Paenibacillus marinisediminis]
MSKPMAQSSGNTGSPSHQAAHAGPRPPHGPGGPHGIGKPKVKPKDMLGTLLKIWAYLSSEKTKLALILFMIVLSSALKLLGPFLLGYAIDHYISTKGDQGLPLLVGALGLTYLGYAAATWLQSIWMINIAQRAVFRMRADLFTGLHRLPIAYFTKRQHGELMSRLTNDMDNVSQTLNSSFIQLSSSILTFIGMLAMMLWLSPLLTLVSLIIVPLLFLGMRWITNRTGPYFKEQQRALGELNGFVEETFSGQKLVKAYSQEEKVTAQFLAKSERLRDAGYWAQMYSGFIPKLMNMLNDLSFALIAGAGGVMAVYNLISIGVIVTFAEYARQFTRPLNDLANQFNTFLSAVAGAERVFEVLEQEPEASDEAHAKPLQYLRGDIEFDRVSFAYDADVQTVSDVSFHVAPGQTAALVGPTGAGKSTLVQLLSRFYELNNGHIRVDGIDIKEITRNSLRGHMGFVLQDSFLFEGSIRDNIRYGRLEASDEEVELAAKQANAHSFIMKLSDGYDTRLDTEGSGISQGQKQLLSIARAILADPAILILDEATSSIDTVTELHIQEALYRLMKDRTSIVIAHRLNTIRQADQILVLLDGRIQEKGSHSELMQQKGYYSQLVEGQYEQHGAYT